VERKAADTKFRDAAECESEAARVGADAVAPLNAREFGHPSSWDAEAAVLLI
jgi:hypothetical protein